MPRILVIMSILSSLLGCAQQSPKDDEIQAAALKQLMAEQEKKLNSEPHPLGKLIAPIDGILGGWVLSPKWWPWMGVALHLEQFEDDEFQYWFYSDVSIGEPEQYPFKGTFEFDGKQIILHGKRNEHFYSRSWFLHELEGQVCLLPQEEWDKLQSGEKWDESRALFRDSQFKPESPFEYQSRNLPRKKE